MKTLAVPPNRMIRLPKSLFKPAERVVVLADKTMFIVKKLESPRASEIALRAPGRAPSLASIVKDVEAVRRARRAR